MKNRILSIALALSLLATAAYAFNVSASEAYTGSVTTTDNTGTPKDTFFQGENVYVNVELNQFGAPYSGSVTVQLIRTTDGLVYDSFTRTTNTPDVGWYNSSGTGTHLHTGYGFSGDSMTYDVVEVYGDIVARHPIVVKATGLTLQPVSSGMSPYYPGQTVTITLVTDHTTTGFYVQVVNTTGATLFNITNQIAWTGWWSYDWTIASNFPDGHFHVNVRDASTDAQWYSAGIYVQKYVLSVNADRTYYLIGETAFINYAVLDQSSMEPYGGVVITYSATWLDLVGNQSWENNTLVGTSGTQSFLIDSTKVNISSNVDITYWANETGTERSYSVTETLYTGFLSAVVSVSNDQFGPGDLVAVTVNAMAGHSNLPGALVDLTVERNNSAVPGYGGSAMVTDFSGTVTHTFRLDANAPTGSYIVNVTVSKVSQSVNEMSVFTVAWGGGLFINFDKNTYYGGDNAQVTFRTVWNGVEMPNEPIGYYVQVSYGILLSGNTTSDAARIPIPTDYYGFLTIFATVNVNGNILDDSETVSVSFANILLTTDQSNYKQGETLTFHWDIVTSLTTANLEWEIVDNQGVTVETDKPSFAKTGSFSVNVPSENPPTSYTATVVMTTDTGGYLTSSVTVTIAGNYNFVLWFGKSGYANGDFKPGQTVKVHYEINAWAAKLPVYQIVISTSLEGSSHTYLVTEESGTVDYVIPKNAPTQLAFVNAMLRDPIADVNLASANMMYYNVNGELGAWDKSVGGMAAIDLLILVLIIVMILLLIIVPFMKGRMGSQPQTMKVSEPPPAPPPSP